MHYRVLFLCLAIMLTSCGYAGMEADIGSTPRLEVNELVQRPWNPMIYIHPANDPTREMTAVMVPFRMRMDMANADHYATEITRVFWQKWLALEVFPGFEFMEGRVWSGPDKAINLARQRNADLAIGGYITQFMAGGSMGESNLAFRLEIYDAVSGNLVWSMEHSGKMNRQVMQDYVFFTKHSRLPSDPLHHIAQTLAEDMAGPILEWLQILRDPEARQDLL